MDEQCAVGMPDGWCGRWIKLRNFSVERWLYHVLSEHWCGNDSAPLSQRTLCLTERGRRVDSSQHSMLPDEDIINVFSFLNDAFEIGIGWPSKWNCILRREVIHSFIWWYLRQWVLGEWLGLRRWLWYKLLFRRISRQRQRASKKSYVRAR